MRTDKEIIEQTNELARRFAELNGWKVEEDFLFYRDFEFEDSKNRSKKKTDAIVETPEMESAKINARARHYWAMACLAQEIITETDVSNATANLGLD